jgi:hypothetical protein
VLKAKSKIRYSVKVGGGHFLYIPASLVKDSAYPFVIGDVVDVEIVPGKGEIIVRKVVESPLLTKVRG